MKAFGVLESKWGPIRKTLVRRLLEEQDQVLGSYFAQKGGTLSKGGDRSNCKGRNMSNGTCMREDGARSLFDSLSFRFGYWCCIRACCHVGLEVPRLLSF
jgi:hypothetical protein